MKSTFNPWRDKVAFRFFFTVKSENFIFELIKLIINLKLVQLKSMIRQYYEILTIGHLFEHGSFQQILHFPPGKKKVQIFSF